MTAKQSTNSASARSNEKYRALLASASVTAGSDSWKTAAGRVDGPDGFVAADAWRMLKLRFKAARIPSVCPVCMDRPSADDGWYITKTCRHAVCRTCLQSYASSLIADPSHSGPLKCPCCPRLLRVEDAKVALDKGLPGARASATCTMGTAVPTPMPTRRHAAAGTHEERGGALRDPGPGVDDAEGADLDSALEDLEKWDSKKRDELLRSMASFRPCPHCGAGSGALSDSGARAGDASCGGGFVTPGCLQPIHEERESIAQRLINIVPHASRATLLAYFIFYWYCTTRTSSARPILQVLLTILPSALLPACTHALRLFLATTAKRAMLHPITVTCPCCLGDFHLDAAAELHPDNASTDAATQRWKHANTRPCPRCASPISKDGGCNHVTCGRCRLHFCWACMRPRTRCQAYRCQNGAPFGESLWSGSERRGAAEWERPGMTLIERIEAVEDAALGNLNLVRSIPLRYVALISIICVVTSSSAVQKTSSLAATFFYSNLPILIPAVLYSVGAFSEFNQRAPLLFRRLLGRGTEDDQLAVAIARSLVEQ